MCILRPELKPEVCWIREVLLVQGHQGGFLRKAEESLSYGSGRASEPSILHCVMTEKRQRDTEAEITTKRRRDKKWPPYFQVPSRMKVAD